MDGEADFAISDFMVKESRAKVIDYLITSEEVEVGRFYIKNPRDTYDWTVFFQPLYLEAWIGLVLFSVIVPILSAMLVYFRKL